LLKHVSGIAACSGGTVPALFIGAGKNFEDFKETFPAVGWQGFGPAEPKITEDFHRFVDKANLPENLKDMSIPIAVSLSMWATDKAMWEPNPNVTALVVNRGSTKDALTAALATGSEGGIPDPDCPKCKRGFWPKEMGNATTITDGAFTDLMGVQGLIGLPKCRRLLHILPLDYPGQIGALPRSEIPGEPEDIVTLFFTQPPVASHGYFFDEGCKDTIPGTSISLWCNPVGNILSGGFAPVHKPSERSGGDWNLIMFDYLNKAAGKTLDMTFDSESEPGHKLITLGTHQLFEDITTKNEEEYNMLASEKRDKYWSNFLSMLARQKNDQDKYANQAKSDYSVALSRVKKLETTYEMPHISIQASLNYPAA
jgi:hypothetical protein